MRRHTELDVLTGIEVIDRTRPHFVFVRMAADLLDAVAADLGQDHFPRRLGRDEGGEEGLHHRRRDLGFGVAPHLQQRLDGLREIGHAAILLGALGVHDVQDVGQSGLTAVGLDPGKLGQRAVRLIRVGVGNVIGHHRARRVDLDAVIDDVAVREMYRRQRRHERIAVRAGMTDGIRRPHAVGFEQMQTQRVRHERRRLGALDEGEHIARHRPRQRDQLLHTVEVVDAGCVTGLLAARPQIELGLRVPLPGFGLRLIHAQRIAIDGRLEPQPRADDVRPLTLERCGGNGRRHVQHPRTLPQRVGVGVDILCRTAALDGKAAQRLLCQRRARLGVAFIDRRQDHRPWGLAHRAHLLFSRM